MCKDKSGLRDFRSTTDICTVKTLFKFLCPYTYAERVGVVVKLYTTFQEVPSSTKDKPRLFSYNATVVEQHWAECKLQLDPVFKNTHVIGQTLITE